MATQFELGLLLGLLVGEGHFGGDGRQPHVTLRMHVRHEAIFRWLERTFPGGRVYGPYHHGGRDYLQWMARGPFLRDELAPLLDRHLSPGLDRHSFDRYQLMKTRYPDLAKPPAAGCPAAEGPSAAIALATEGPSAAMAPATAGPASPTEPAGPPRTAPRPVRRRAATTPPATPAPRPAMPAPGPGEFDDLFAELRHAWPS